MRIISFIVLALALCVAADVDTPISGADLERRRTVNIVNSSAIALAVPISQNQPVMSSAGVNADVLPNTSSMVGVTRTVTTTNGHSKRGADLERRRIVATAPTAGNALAPANIQPATSPVTPPVTQVIANVESSMAGASLSFTETIGHSKRGETTSERRRSGGNSAPSAAVQAIVAAIVNSIASQTNNATSHTVLTGATSSSTTGGMEPALAQENVSTSHLGGKRSLERRRKAPSTAPDMAILAAAAAANLPLSQASAAGANPLSAGSP